MAGWWGGGVECNGVLVRGWLFAGEEWVVGQGWVAQAGGMGLPGDVGIKVLKKHCVVA